MGGGAERVGKAIPNEFSKLAGAADLLNFIPGIGPALAIAVKTIGAIDTAATVQGDTGDFGLALRTSAGGFGRSQDPGRFGSGPTGGQPDTLTKIGQIASLFAPALSAKDPNALPSNARILLPGDPEPSQVQQGQGGFGDENLDQLLQQLSQVIGQSGQGIQQGSQIAPVIFPDIRPSQPDAIGALLAQLLAVQGQGQRAQPQVGQRAVQPFTQRATQVLQPRFGTTPSVR